MYNLTTPLASFSPEKIKNNRDGSRMDGESRSFERTSSKNREEGLKESLNERKNWMESNATAGERHVRKR